MTEIIVKTQAELDAALARDDYDTHEIIINSPAGVWITIGDDHDQDVRASGSATVRASDSATVRASGSATVRASGSATVRASGSATVKAWGSATVRAGSHVAIHLFSARATVSGGVVIDIAALDQHDPRTWCDLHGVPIDDDGNAHLFKAVDDSLTAGHSWAPTAYAIGSDPRCDEWVDNHDCGGGLHVCPTARQARAHYSAATRYLEVAAPLDSIRPIDATKCKAPTVHVLREVDIDGQPLTTPKATLS